MASSEEFAQTIYVGKVPIPPLSSLLDVRTPFVELEADRLHTSVSWLYGAVQALQQQGLKLDSELRQLQAQAKEKEKSQKGLDLASLEASTLPGDDEDLRMRLWQQEQRQGAERAQLELRVEALAAAVESRLQPADLEAFDGKVTQRLDQMSQQSKQDISSLARLLEGNQTADRRQLQDNFESLRCKVEAHLGVMLSESGVQNDTVKAAIAAAEAAARKAHHQDVSRALPTPAAEPSAPEDTTPNPERRHSGQGIVDMHVALQSRVEQLERSVHFLSQRSADPVPQLPVQADTGTGSSDALIWQRFTDVDQAHIMTVQRMSELESKLHRMEGRKGQRDGSKTALQANDWEAPISELQSSHASLAEEVAAHVLPQVSTLRSTLTQITKYISGEMPDEDVSLQSASALDWLEHRVGALTKSRALTLEARLQLLEQATGSTEIFQKVQNLEQILGKLDVDAVNEVPPQLIIVKEDQEAFKQDLRREVQELKVLVGCMEACVPKETRKAIQLFKRGAGVSDEELITAGGLKLHADVEALREELQTRLAEVETSSAQQHDNLSSMVQELEMKQEKLHSVVRKRFTSDDVSVCGVDSFVAPQGWKHPASPT